jgi:hypothetical protein
MAAVLLVGGATQATATPLSFDPAIQVVQAPMLLTATAQAQPPAQPGGEVKIDVDLDDDGGVWYTDPLWIVLAAAAVIIVVALVAMAARGGGGGTTVVR